MVINLMRSDPKSMIPQIRSIKQHKFYKGQPIQPLVDYLNSIEPLPLVTLDEHACQACRNNTDRKMKTDEDTGKDHFEKGGNQEEFQGMIGNGKGIETTECTQIGWNGSAQDLIFFLLVDGFKDQKSHAILDPKLIKVGISFKAHKKLHNVFQILYVKQISNNMN
ncbi:UNKNOWN [Stylonychia lemnae]|uniref:Uncharacterized protein n=1 Tax=Stylonychia lemnae TaxID=5949 RepID=A0A078A206_STYLE|nr:UNKNOWN [Stylonychia lemnae]|eukprot:CDW75837.1 UNKNOWN [Stylonychia lemnae]